MAGVVSRSGEKGGGQRSCDDSERNGFAPGADGTSLSRVLDRAGRDSAVSE